MGTSYTSAVGVPPVCTSLAFLAWMQRLLAYRLAEIPLARGTTYYFSQSGNDTTGDGSQANPWKTISKANTVIGNWTSTSAGLRLRFNRGDIWRETTGLTINKSHVTVDDYGTGKRKPLFNRFAITYNTSWTLDSGAVYRRAETNDIAWFRQQNDLTTAFSRQNSIANVQANPGSFWWDSTGKILYMQSVDGIAPTSSFRAYEAVTSNATAASSGILVTADDVRVQNIRCDGWGCDRTTPHNNTAYNFMSQLTAGQSALFVGCEGYYSGSHIMGTLDTGAGGITTWISPRFGWQMYTSAGNTAINGYSHNGGHEFFVYDYECIGGVLPSSDGGSNSKGTAIYGHTSSGTAALYLCWRGRVVGGKYQAHSSAGFFNAASFTDLADCRAFVVDDVLDASDLAMSGQFQDAAVGEIIARQYNVVINPRYRFSTGAWTGGSQSQVNATSNNSGIAINGDFRFDARQYKGSAGTGMFYSVGPNSLSVYNCRFELMRTGLRHRSGFFFPCANNDTNPATGNMHNCIYAVNDVGGDALTDNTVGWNNDAALMRNNIYCGVQASLAANVRGYSNDPYAVVLDSPPDRTPSSGSLLLSANQQPIMGYRLEYDARWQRRNYGSTAIGPYEVDQGPVPVAEGVR
jgi:hypothetical protein